MNTEEKVKDYKLEFIEKVNQRLRDINYFTGETSQQEMHRDYVTVRSMINILLKIRGREGLPMGNKVMSESVYREAIEILDTIIPN